jgi:hypothetical protein
MGQPQILRNHAPFEHFPPLTNNALQQNNGTQNIKQLGRPLNYSRDIISDEESMDNEDETQNHKKTKTDKGHKRTVLHKQ